MPKTLCRLIAGVAALCFLATATPAHAATRADQRRRAAQRAAKLDALRASDRDLANAVAALNGQVDAQVQQVTAAKQAAVSAQLRLDDANAKLQATEGRLSSIRTSLVGYAVDLYMRPERTPGFDSTDMATASRQRALLAMVEKQTGDVLDELRSARQDLARRQSAASKARDDAAARRRDEAAQLNTLAKNLSDKQRLSSALEARIREAEAEDNAGNEATGYFRTDANFDPGAASRAGLIWPVHGPVTSPFGMRWGRMHQGIDIAASTGTPIHAAKAGKVVFSGWMSGYGNAVIIDHGGGFATLYGHQSQRAVQEGDLIKQGGVLGYVGCTGHCTGPHLHFETRVNGTPENPRRYLP